VNCWVTALLWICARGCGERWSGIGWAADSLVGFNVWVFVGLIHM
jgi:hypothetical protein